MEPCTIKDRFTPWTIAITAVLTALLMYAFRETTGFVIALAVCGLVVILCVLVLSYTVTLTRDGITCKNLFRPMTAAWSEVASVSVVPVAKRWYICITRKDKQDVLVPYSKELKNAIITYRGFLDRDDMAKPQ